MKIRLQVAVGAMHREAIYLNFGDDCFMLSYLKIANGGVGASWGKLADSPADMEELQRFEAKLNRKRKFFCWVLFGPDSDTGGGVWRKTRTIDVYYRQGLMTRRGCQFEFDIQHFDVSKPLWEKFCELPMSDLPWEMPLMRYSFADFSPDRVEL